jgi:hypothetical protein
MTEPYSFMTPDVIVSRSPDLLMAEVDGETVLMSVSRGSYFGLANTAKDIWARLEVEMSAGDLCGGLAETYEGDPAVIAVETLAFLGRMFEAGLIRVVPSL